MRLRTPNILANLFFYHFCVACSTIPSLPVCSVGHALCEPVKHQGMLLQCHGPVFTSWLMKSLCMSAHLVMLRTGSASAPRSTRADCASSMLVSETPAVMEPHASQSRNWKLYVYVPMEGKVCCVTNVSVTALHRSMQCRLNSLIKRLICKHCEWEPWAVCEWEPLVG